MYFYFFLEEEESFGKEKKVEKKSQKLRQFEVLL